jgi:SAM-dependent methyltransferase
MPTSFRLDQRDIQASIVPRLQQWFDGPVGQRTFEIEQALVNQLLGSSFGYYLLQLGIAPHLPLYAESRVQRNIQAGLYQTNVNQPRAPGFVAQCNLDELPFAENSLDVLIIHHWLEFCSDPHSLLREAQRVLVPHGRLIIVAFNPLSFFGLKGLYGRLWPRSPWRQHMLTNRRIRDWLQLLGFGEYQVQFGVHRPPYEFFQSRKPELDYPGWLGKLPTGGIMVMSAVKDVVGLTALRPQWQAPPRIPALVGASREAVIKPFPPRSFSSRNKRYDLRSESHNESYKVPPPTE